MYMSRSKDLSATEAALVDPYSLKEVRDQVLEIYQSTEDKVSTDDWGSPEFYEYLSRFEAVEQSEAFKTIQDQLRVILDTNHLQFAYIVCFDEEAEATIYLVDASYEDNCPPGAFDAIMYDVDRAAMKNPEEGIEPDVTNTDEYGWVVAAGSPVFLDGELIAFACADISMNEVINQRNQFMMIAAAALLVMAALFILLGLQLVDRMIIQPINQLSTTSEKYWSGETSEVRNEFSKLSIHTGDEIEELSESMKQMEQNINDHITQILETTQDLMTTREHAEEMDRAANIDALTKVRNRRAYDLETERINQEIREGKKAFGIAMIDLNYLKKINDTYGHEQGNIAIQKLCRTICGVFQHSPVFRVGGDEFVVILENHDLEDLDRLKAQFEAELGKLQEAEDPKERISAAAGYALYDPTVDRDTESVFKRADQLMYERKKAMKAERTV